MKTELKKNCSKCKYADWDADGCTCMIEKRLIGNAFAYVCDNFNSAKPFTNGDRIRQMTDEELAERFGFEECKDSRYGYECPGWHAEDCGHATCKKYFLEWLKQEVQDGTD